MSLSDDTPTDPKDAGEAWLLEGLKEKKDDSPFKAADAIRELGGSWREQIVAVGRVGRPSRRQARAQAERSLGGQAPEARGPQTQLSDYHKQKWLATDWRYHVIGRCKVRKERARLVALLEENLDGTETELPQWISDSVVKILAFADRQKPDVNPFISSEVVYRQLAEGWHRSQNTAS